MTAEGAGIAFAALGATPKTPEGAAQLYDDWAGTYDETLISWGYEAHTGVAALVKEHLSDHANATVLDLGCGTGLSGMALQQAGLAGKHAGVDISPVQVEMANQLPCYGGGVFVGSLDEPLKEEVLSKGPFDTVICVGTTSYVHEYDHLLTSVLAALKPGGVFIFTITTLLWDVNAEGVQTACAKFISEGQWLCESISEPGPYMPRNPDPVENVKRIRYCTYRKVAAN